MRRGILLTAVAIVAATLNPAHAADYTVLTDVRVPMSDGVVLAADVYVPTASDRDGDGRHPCVVELTPYRKESRYSEGASFLPSQGIVLIEVDARGTGGSAGEYDIVFSVREQADAAEWVEWAATTATKPGTPDPLCESTVGMYGGSYSGIIQYLVASLPDAPEGNLPARPPHLAAIAPQRAYGDLYRDIVYHGGMLIGSFGTIWSAGTTAYYTQPPTDVQTDAGRAAWLDHLTRNDPLQVAYVSNQYADATWTSDDTTPSYSQKLYDDSSILPRIENLTIPTLHLAGWFDAFTRGQLLTFSKAYELEQRLGDRGPNYLIVGPWNHSGTHFIKPDQGYKQLLADWYHCWLESVAAACGALPEHRVRYFQMTSGIVNAQSDGDGRWVEADQWPPVDAIEVKDLYLQPNGGLSFQLPPEDGRFTTYVYEPTAGKAEILSRWDNAAGTPHPQHDQRLEGPSVATFQTAPLADPLAIAGPIGMTVQLNTIGLPGTGAPVAAWPEAAQLTPPYHDTDIVVKVSDVAPDGSARLVTQGYLRASHRKVNELASIRVDGRVLAPYHPHTFESLDPPRPNVAERYQIEIWPTAKTFEPGHRIRVDISSADTPNHLTLLKPAVNSIIHNTSASAIHLPVVPG